MTKRSKILLCSLLGSSIIGISGIHNAQAHAQQAVNILYAGSMTKTLESEIGPAFERDSGVKFEGEGAGSSQLAQMIRSHLKQPDVFISASPSVNDKILMGTTNGNLERWYLTVARDELVIAYNPYSRFAADLRKKNTPWYSVMTSKGFRLGRTDPKLDPKGVSTVLMAKLAEKYYGKPGLSNQLLGDIENPVQVYPEEALLARLGTGQLDAVVAYKHEAIEWHVPYVSLPPQINLGDEKQSSYYSKVSISVNGKVSKGSPIVFTVSIPSTAKDENGAEEFVQYLLRGKGHKQLLQDGFTAMPTLLAGNKADVPQSLQGIIQGQWGQ